MQTVETDHQVVPAKSINKSISVAIILVILFVIASYISNAYEALHPASLPQGTVTISQSALEEQYGLRVNLVAVTAAGGMVDVRLKITDGEKAKLLLQDKNNFPVLFVSDDNITLNASEDAKSQEIKFEDDGNIFLMFPNNGNAVKSGASISVLFGSIRLEPIIAK